MSWVEMRQYRRLRYLESELAKYETARDTDYRRAFKDQISHRDLGRDWDYEISEIRGEIDELKSGQSIRLARKYDIPLPVRADDIDADPNWYQDYAGAIILTQIGRAYVRGAVRQEQRERWERRARWILILTAATGFLGAVIGVLSFLRG